MRLIEALPRPRSASSSAEEAGEFDRAIRQTDMGLRALLSLCNVSYKSNRDVAQSSTTTPLYTLGHPPNSAHCVPFLSPARHGGVNAWPVRPLAMFYFRTRVRRANLVIVSLFSLFASADPSFPPSPFVSMSNPSLLALSAPPVRVLDVAPNA